MEQFITQQKKNYVLICKDYALQVMESSSIGSIYFYFYFCQGYYIFHQIVISFSFEINTDLTLHTPTLVRKVIKRYFYS